MRRRRFAHVARAGRRRRPEHAGHDTPVTSRPIRTRRPDDAAVIPAPGNASTFVNVLGDTGWCGSPALGPLARLFERFDGDILLAGDLAYPSGTMEEFRNCFEPSFGKFKSRMRASPGNHDYVASVSAQSYFDYFGDRSGPNRRGYYSFSAAEWTVLMLNSNVPINKTSAQYAFVRNTMQQSPTRCTMAVMHHPFDSSGLNGPTPSLRDIWELMYNLGGDVGDRRATIICMSATRR
jgi:3',5'-cyclic AMP phosphodiesterase CpdA